MKGAASQQLRPGGGHLPGDGGHLLRRLHGAWPGNEAEVLPDAGLAHGYHRVLRMPCPGRQRIRLRQPLYRPHAGQKPQTLPVQPKGFPLQHQHLPAGMRHRNAGVLQPLPQRLPHRRRLIFLCENEHMPPPGS